tara:strand:+ start:4727 stop:5236 length:510 start_codon:yes stop_codon:yes gene_type:complete
MKSKAVITVRGNVGNIEYKQSATGGKGRAILSIATEEVYKKDGQTVKETVWYRAVAFTGPDGTGGLAEHIGRMCRNGTGLEVSGKPKMREFTNNENQKVQFLEILIDEVDFLNNYGEPKDANAPQATQQPVQQAAPVQQAPVAKPTYQQAAPQAQGFAKPQANVNPFQR